MKQWRLSGSTVGCATGLPAFGLRGVESARDGRRHHRTVCRLPRQSNSDKTHLATGCLIPSKVDLHFIANRALSNFHRKASKLKPNARYLNVACGQKGIDSEEWFNIDGFPTPRVDMVWDLTRSLPFEDQRFDGIYAEHFFEHLEPVDARTFLRECLRCLRPGGTIRLSVPDGELYLRRYFE